jgi:hypothetical protein
MLNDFRTAQIYHREYLRRHVRLPDGHEHSPHGLREVIGHRLISLGERLSRVDRSPTLNRAA